MLFSAPNLQKEKKNLSKTKNDNVIVYTYNGNNKTSYHDCFHSATDALLYYVLFFDRITHI